MFVLTHQAWHRAANFLEAREVPEIWKIAALLRLHRLHRAIVAFQENAAAVGPLLQREAAAILGEPREPLDEIGL
jgi:hypothetical protein